jgi:magnesium transporter
LTAEPAGNSDPGAQAARGLADSWRALARDLAQHHPTEAARVLESAETAAGEAILSDLDGPTRTNILEALPAPEAGRFVLAMPAPLREEALRSLDVRHAAAILLRLLPEERSQVLAGLPPPLVRELEQFANYPPETAAAAMNPRVTAVPCDLTVGEAIERLRRASPQTLYYPYVTDREGRLVGVLQARTLLLAEPHQRVEDVMTRSVVSIPAFEDRERIPAIFQEHGYIALPVVDAEGRLLGVVQPDEAIAIAQAEAAEDLQRLFGLDPEEKAFSPVSFSLRRRLPWLLVNLGTAFLAAGVVALFEATIAKVTALAVLLPIVAGQGGNSGAQALAVVIRGLSLKEIRRGRGQAVVRKEAILGLLNGLAVALVTATGVWLWERNPALGAVIGSAMVVNMVVAGVAGSGIPILLRFIGRDPAQSGSILLTTVTDCVGFFSFLGLATIFAEALGAA